VAIGIDQPNCLAFANISTGKYALTPSLSNMHTAAVRALKYINNSQLVSVSGNDFKKWNLLNSNNDWSTFTDDGQYSIELLKSGNLVTGSSDGHIREFDSSTGYILANEGIHTAQINALVVLDNGDLASGSDDNHIKVCTPGSYSACQIKINAAKKVKSLKLLPNGNLASGLDDGKIKIWHILSKSLVLNFKAHDSSVNALEVLDNGNLASGSSDNTIRIWHGGNFSCLGQLIGHTNPIYALKLLSNCLLASGSQGTYLRIWDTNSMTQKYELDISAIIYAIEQLDDNRCSIKNTYVGTTPFNIAPNTTFNLGQISSAQTIQLLNSNYDMGGCLVNCTNHGSCVFDSANNKFLCVCDAYFTGTACEIDTRACSSSPCLNNATCVDLYSNSSASVFSCECGLDYEGVYCQNKINVCANETCSSNGVCEDVNSLPKCKCFSMYEGEKCGTQSNQLKTIQSLISMTSVIAIIVIVCFYLMIIVMDLIRFFTRSSNGKLSVIRKGMVTKYVYYN
jgi:WD40 repeat protein